MRALVLILSALCFMCSLSQATPKIVVHGRRDRSLSPVGKSEVGGKSLSGFAAGETVGRALEEEPAVQVLADSGGELSSVPRFLIRGQDNVENRYFLEGFPLNNARLNQPDLELLSTNFFPTLELYAGGVPIHFGEDGLGGAVQFGLSPWEAPTKLLARGGSLGSVSATADVRSGERLNWG
ncbi:MAG: Plug domain-containing protein [Bdellovibrionota bacterium]